MVVITSLFVLTGEDKELQLLIGVTLLVCAGGLTQVQVVVPQGIESVNGSAVDMGCTSPLVDSGGVLVCCGCSYLTDGVSPDIDTSTSDWASQLVAVRRNEGSLNPALGFPHVLLTFGLDTAVSLIRIEMDLFLCPDWNIGGPSMYVYLDSDYNLVFHIGHQFVGPVNPSQSSCGSLSTVTFTGGSFLTGSYHTVHILVDLSVDDSIEWVHVGEFRLIGINGPTCIQLNTSTSPTISSSDTPLSSSTISSSDTPLSSSKRGRGIASIAFKSISLFPLSFQERSFKSGNCLLCTLLQ